MNFSDYSFRYDLLEDFESVINNYKTLTEADLGDLQIAKVIEKGLDEIKLPSVKAVVGVVADMAKKSGATTSDILNLFSKDGLSKIVNGIKDNILNTAELKYIIRYFDPNRYKGYKGLEQYIKDMQEENPSILDPIKKIATKFIK